MSLREDVAAIAKKYDVEPFAVEAIAREYESARRRAARAGCRPSRISSEGRRAISAGQKNRWEEFWRRDPGPVASIPGSLQQPPPRQPEPSASACDQTKKDQ